MSATSWEFPPLAPKPTKRKARDSPKEKASSDDESIFDGRRCSIRTPKNRIEDSDELCAKKLDRKNREKHKGDKSKAKRKKRRDTSPSTTTSEDLDAMSYLSEDSSPEVQKSQRLSRKVVGIPEIEFGEEPELYRNSDYKDMPASALGSLALDWLKESEDIRKKCGRIQGSLSNRLKTRLQGLMGIVRAFIVKAEEKGDPKFWKVKNAELSTQLNVSKKVEIKCRKELVEMKSKVKSLEEEIVELKYNEESERSKSLEIGKNNKKREKKGGRVPATLSGPVEKELSVDTEGDQYASMDVDQDVVMRPPLRGMSQSRSRPMSGSIGRRNK